MEPMTIKGLEILEQFGKGEVVSKALQRAGLKILLGVGLVSVFVIIGVGWQWISQSPKFPALPTSAMDTQQITNSTNLLENYKTAGELALSR